MCTSMRAVTYFFLVNSPWARSMNGVVETLQDERQSMYIQEEVHVPDAYIHLDNYAWMACRQRS
jgi:hypothetical protein